MGYEDFFETLNELLTTFNEPVDNMPELNTADIDGPFFSYMFDKYDGAFDDLREFMEEEIRK